MEQIGNNFKDFYYLTEKAEVFNSKTKKYVLPYKHNYKLMTLENKQISISIKELYQLVYNKVYCIDNIENLPNEVWKEIPGTAGRYFCSNMGRVKSYCKYEAQLIKPANSHGYERLQIIQGGTLVSKFVHRLVAQCFMEPPADIDYQLHHIDFNSMNNEVSNLKWLSPAEHKKIHEAHQ